MDQIQTEIERLRELLRIAEIQRDEAMRSLSEALEALDDAQAQCADLIDGKSVGMTHGCIDVFGQPE